MKIKLGLFLLLTVFWSQVAQAGIEVGRKASQKFFQERQRPHIIEPWTRHLEFQLGKGLSTGRSDFYKKVFGEISEKDRIVNKLFSVNFGANLGQLSIQKSWRVELQNVKGISGAVQKLSVQRVWSYPSSRAPVYARFGVGPVGLWLGSKPKATFSFLEYSAAVGLRIAHVYYSKIAFTAEWAFHGFFQGTRSSYEGKTLSAGIMIYY